MKDIGARLHLDSGTLTPLLKRLQTSGYVTRRRNPANERQLRVKLTSEGQSLQSRMAEVRKSLICSLGITEPSTQILRKQVDVVTGLLRSISEAPASSSGEFSACSNDEVGPFAA